MTTSPYLEEENINYVLETVETITKNTGNRRAGEKGEEVTNQYIEDLYLMKE